MPRGSTESPSRHPSVFHSRAVDHPALRAPRVLVCWALGPRYSGIDSRVTCACVALQTQPDEACLSCRGGGALSDCLEEKAHSTTTTATATATTTSGSGGGGGGWRWRWRCLQSST